MGSVVRYVHDKFYIIIMVLIAGGFVTLVAELLWTNHTDGIQLVAVFASIAGVLLGVAALFVKGTGRLVVAALFLALSITGLVGAMEHNEARGEEGEAYQRSAPVDSHFISYRLDEGEEADEEGEGREGGEESGEAVPPLAPLGLSGLALMGATVLVAYSGPSDEKKSP